MTLIKTVKPFTFVNDGSSIANSNLMISAGRFTYADRLFILAQCHRNKFNAKIQQLFKEGIRKHEQAQAQYKTINEIGYVNYRKLLYQNKKISIKELGAISIKERMFGYIDLFQVEFTKDGILNIWITEFKSSSFRFAKHFTQLTVYAMIAADINSKLVYEVPYKRKKGNKRLMGYLFPKHSDIKEVNVKGRIFLLDETLYQPYDDIVVKDEFTSSYAKRKLGLEKKRSKFRDFILKGTVDIAKVKYCRGCTDMKKRYNCGQLELCNKHPYDPKSTQMHWGLNKMLIKTKPRIITT